MRTFIAIDIPSSIRETIRELIDYLKPAANQLRWSRPEALHVTLKFLGEVPLPKVEQVKAALALINASEPIHIAIRGSGHFPNARSPRVIWLGVEGGAALQELAAHVERTLEPLGFAKENRPFSPHLTLARVSTPGKIFAVQELLRTKEPLDFGSFTADEFFLYESKLSRGGSIYTKIARFAMAANGSSKDRP